MTEDPAAPPHRCSFCPVSVRTLYASAYNAMLALDMARAGLGDWDRAWRKFAEMRDIVTALQPLLDAHFRGVEIHGVES